MAAVPGSNEEIIEIEKKRAYLKGLATGCLTMCAAFGFGFLIGLGIKLMRK